MAEYFFVNSSWTNGWNSNGQTQVNSWLTQSCTFEGGTTYATNSAWLAANYPTVTSLTYGTNAFQDIDDAAESNAARDKDIVICLLSNATFATNPRTISITANSMTIVSADPSTCSVTLTSRREYGYSASTSPVYIDCPFTISEGVDCTVGGSGELNVYYGGNASGSGALTVNGSLTTSTLTGAGNVAVNGSVTATTYNGSGTVSVGDGATMSVTNYSGSGDLNVGDGANVTITNYSGTGTITLDGNGTLNITNISSGATVHVDVKIDPDTTGVLPYSELMSNNSINFRTAVTDFDTKPVCVTNNNHTLYYAPKDYYYVNSGYTGSAIPDVLAASGMSRTTVADAVTSAGTASASIFITGGTFGVATAGQAVAFNGHNAQILGVVTGSSATIVNGSARFTSSVAGGECITSAAKSFTFTKAAGEDTHLEINGGTFGKTLVGGDFVTQGNAYRDGSTNLTINGGEFVSTVGGGMAYTPKNTDGTVTLTGNVNFLITGGTFNRRIYGGNICCNGYGGQTTLMGSVNLTIDASANTIAFKDHIVAGSFDNGQVGGSTNVTLKGSGSNLKTKTDGGLVAFSGTILGGSGATYIRTTGGTRECTSFVTGSRNFAFEGFTGEFAGEIKAFQNISFTKGAAVQFTNEALNLQDISSWNLAFGSSLTATKGSNNFAGDSLALDLTGWNNSAWTVMSGTEDFFTNWNAFDSVSLCGQTATYANSKWASASYQLTLETSGDTKMLVLAAKA